MRTILSTVHIQNSGSKGGVVAETLNQTSEPVVRWENYVLKPFNEQEPPGRTVKNDVCQQAFFLCEKNAALRIGILDSSFKDQASQAL